MTLVLPGLHLLDEPFQRLVGCLDGEGKPFFLAFDGLDLKRQDRDTGVQFLQGGQFVV